MHALPDAVSDEIPNGELARTRWSKREGRIVIELTEETYLNLRADQHRARFSFWHEVGHAFNLAHSWLKTIDPWCAGIVDEPTCRTWRLYMAGAAHAFAIGRINVYQTLLVKPDDGRSGMPLTRADWYAADAGGAA